MRKRTIGLCALGIVVLVFVAFLGRFLNNSDTLNLELAPKGKNAPIKSDDFPMHSKVKLPIDQDFARIIDQKISEISQPVDISIMQKGWRADAEDEIARISKETFAESHAKLADFNDNYLRLALDLCTSPTDSGLLHLIFMSRRFGKLVESLQEDSAAESKNHLLAQYSLDIEEFCRRKKKDPYHFGDRHTMGFLFDPQIKDQSELTAGLAYRLTATQLIIGQTRFWEALPLLMRDFDARRDTQYINWTSVSYATDMILSSPPPDELGKQVLSVQQEYVKWKRRTLEQDTSASSYLEQNIQMMPSYQSPLRPGQREMLARLGKDSSEQFAEGPYIELSLPKIMQSEIHLSLVPEPKGVQAEIIECGRKVLATGAF